MLKMQKYPTHSIQSFFIHCYLLIMTLCLSSPQTEYSQIIRVMSKINSFQKLTPGNQLPQKLHHLSNS